MKHFTHENILPLLTLVPPVNTVRFKDVYIVTQLMESDLSVLIENNFEQITPQHVQYFMHQILSGLYALHSANVLHRDLKPENVMINSDCQAKIGDFGLSRGIELRWKQQQDAIHSTATLASLWYRPPELLLGSNVASHAIDIWAAGCIMFELLTGESLFPGNNPRHQLNIIVGVLGMPSGDTLDYLINTSKQHLLSLKEVDGNPLAELLPPDVDSLAFDLLDRMLQFDPRDRISAEEALRHPYFKMFDFQPINLPLFDYSFEKEINSSKTIKDFIYEEVRYFNRNYFERDQLNGRVLNDDVVSENEITSDEEDEDENDECDGERNDDGDSEYDEYDAHSNRQSEYEDGDGDDDDDEASYEEESDWSYQYTPGSSRPPSEPSTPLGTNENCPWSESDVEEDWFEVARQLQAERQKHVTLVGGETGQTQ